MFGQSRYPANMPVVQQQEQSQVHFIVIEVTDNNADVYLTAYLHQVGITVFTETGICPRDSSRWEDWLEQNTWQSVTQES